MLVWPARATVDSALARWAAESRVAYPELVRLGCFGSYATGDWGVGSDLDLVAILRHSDVPFERRALAWDLTSLPVSADLLVYTESEWGSLIASDTRFARTLALETRWLIGR